MAVDGSGNFYVTGQSKATNGKNDYATIKCSSAGVTLWTNFCNGIGNGDDYAYSLAVDGTGNVYVTGFMQASLQNSDYGTIKYSSAGAPLWTNLFHGASYAGNSAASLAVDGSQNVYVTGYSFGGATGFDWTTIKYSGPISALPTYNKITSQILPAGKVRLGFVGNPGTNYALDRATSLISPNWSPQTTNPADSSGVLVFTNTPNAATANFWRVRSVP
jgi:hypothetical protein